MHANKRGLFTHTYRGWDLALQLHENQKITTLRCFILVLIIISIAESFLNLIQTLMFIYLLLKLLKLLEVLM